ncbi:hypothetical protein [Lysobacter sp. F6437]|uniref:hypothetical protein n=1 Tax=Lysobacter sp. F6437 TaxID=3459296 RepID=UPI00403D6583
MSVTYTDEGTIPHLAVVTEHGTIHAPVKLERYEHGKGYRLELSPMYGGGDRLPKPMRRDGRLVFALPAGGEVLG